MAGYIIDENKNLLSDANTINNLYQNAPDNPVVFWTYEEVKTTHLQSYFDGLLGLMQKYIGNTDIDLNDAEIRINLYADWLSLYMALIQGVSNAMTMQSRCLSYY